MDVALAESNLQRLVPKVEAMTTVLGHQKGQKPVATFFLEKLQDCKTISHCILHTPFLECFFRIYVCMYV
jgi:hypothetical protein